MKTLARRNRLNTKPKTNAAWLIVVPGREAINQLMLQALIADVEAVRFTPAGVPALNLRLQHMSQVEEVGTLRSIDVLVKSVAFGTVAERLTKQALGSEWKFQGFVASPRNSKQLVFHIQDFFQV